MSDYKERFKRKFLSGKYFDQATTPEEVLAFIEEELERERERLRGKTAFGAVGWYRGVMIMAATSDPDITREISLLMTDTEKARADERSRILAMVEGMELVDVAQIGPAPKMYGTESRVFRDAYNAALDDLTQKIRGEEIREQTARQLEEQRGAAENIGIDVDASVQKLRGLPPLQEETECCPECRGRGPRGGGTLPIPCCRNESCECHEETEKEGASFSGRGECLAFIPGEGGGAVCTRKKPCCIHGEPLVIETVGDALRVAEQIKKHWPPDQEIPDLVINTEDLNVLRENPTPLIVNLDNIEEIARDGQKKLRERHPTPAEEAELLNPTPQSREQGGEKIVCRETQACLEIAHTIRCPRFHEISPKETNHQ